MSTTTSDAIPYALTRIGTLMSPEPGNPLEVEGVLNPATVRDAAGDVHVLPRLVAAGNVSRIGRARVIVVDGVPTGVEREGIVLAPDRSWERADDHAGVEDPRTTWMPSLGRYVMTYVAFGPLGPHPALAVSADGEEWTRLGPVQFAYEDDLDCDLNIYPNKDVVFFPEVVPDPTGRPSYAMLHRPMWELDHLSAGETPRLPAGVTDDRPSIWISYIDADAAQRDIRALARPERHRTVAGPEYDWEQLKIGAGPAPLRVPEGWLVLHHGASGRIEQGSFVPQKNVRYCAGAMLLDPDDPSRVLARTAEPLMEPGTGDEIVGTVGNVVFPTAIEAFGDDLYVFYGMADTRIGVARLDAVRHGRITGDR